MRPFFIVPLKLYMTYDVNEILASPYLNEEKASRFFNNSGGISIPQKKELLVDMMIASRDKIDFQLINNTNNVKEFLVYETYNSEKDRTNDMIEFYSNYRNMVSNETELSGMRCIVLLNFISILNVLIDKPQYSHTLDISKYPINKIKI